jgi:hypothetical protein
LVLQLISYPVSVTRGLENTFLTYHNIQIRYSLIDCTSQEAGLGGYNADTYRGYGER